VKVLVAEVVEGDRLVQIPARENRVHPLVRHPVPPVAERKGQRSEPAATDV
jgi:hypothetical protein